MKITFVMTLFAAAVMAAPPIGDVNPKAVLAKSREFVAQFLATDDAQLEERDGTKTCKLF